MQTKHKPSNPTETGLVIGRDGIKIFSQQFILITLALGSHWYLATIRNKLVSVTKLFYSSHCDCTFKKRRINTAMDIQNTEIFFFSNTNRLFSMFMIRIVLDICRCVHFKTEPKNIHYITKRIWGCTVVSIGILHGFCMINSMVIMVWYYLYRSAKIRSL